MNKCDKCKREVEVNEYKVTTSVGTDYKTSMISMNKLLLFKKIVASILCVVMILTLTACEKQRQDNLSDRMYEYGVAAYEIIDDYFSGKLTADKAADKLAYNYDLQNYLYEKEKQEYNVDALFGTPVDQDAFVMFSTSIALYAMEDKSDGTGTDADIHKAQDDLEKALWK